MSGQRRTPKKGDRVRVVFNGDCGHVIAVGKKTYGNQVCVAFEHQTAFWVPVDELRVIHASKRGVR